MKNESVTLVSKNMEVSSRKVAEVFGKQHQRVLHSIKQLNTSDSFRQSNFRRSSYLSSQNKEMPEVIMTRDGFAMLAMGFTGDKAGQWKEAFLRAFNAMEQRLAKESDKLEWKAACLQIGQVRRSFTETVKQFVEYATAQGSESAFRYYQLLTTMEYKALGLLEMQKTALGNFRDTLDLMDISHLQVAEMTAKGALQHAMDVKMHYKEAFQFAKQKVTAYAEAVSFLKIAVSPAAA